MTLAAHTRIHGPLPRVPAHQLIEEVERSGLRGRGGADFPTARKLRAVAERRRVGPVRRQRLGDRAGEREGPAAARRGSPIWCSTARCSRPARSAPREVIVKVGERCGRRRCGARGRDRGARARPGVRISVAAGPEGYVTGEESAVVHYLNGGAPAADVRPAAAVRARLPRPPDADPEPRDARPARARRPLRLALVPRARHRGRSRLGARHDHRRGRGAGRLRARVRDADERPAGGGRRAVRAAPGAAGRRLLRDLGRGLAGALGCGSPARTCARSAARSGPAC